MNLVVDALSRDAHRVAGGHLVIPRVLPMYVPDAVLGVTVAEWLGLEPSETVGDR